MCGIAGFMSFDGEPAGAHLLASMAASLRHRGPDGEGFYREGGLGLAHRRLSIIDLEGGHQPMATQDGSAWIVFNGEIYNYLELRRELERDGHHFQNKSDTEVILHLYQERGTDCVNYLRGMFSFALWDRTKRSLFLARDRVGIKPLYYFANNSTFVFASELKALLLHPQVPRQVDPIAISEFLTYLYVPTPRTAFRDVQKLPPAHVLTVSDGRVTSRRYWQLPRVVQNRPIQQWREDLEATLDEALRIHMRSDVPVGALLSGGIDSTLERTREGCEFESKDDARKYSDGNRALTATPL